MKSRDWPTPDATRTSTATARYHRGSTTGGPSITSSADTRRSPTGIPIPCSTWCSATATFLNADHEYTHKNKSIKGFGSYGDIMIRDRKMYVVPTPFHLVEGVAHRQTLILPHDVEAGGVCFEVGELQPARGRRTDRRLFLRPQDQRTPSPEGDESRRGQGACLPGLAAERHRGRTGGDAGYPAGIADSSGGPGTHGTMTCG